ncbi:hypothetical protein LTS10_005202 [Elasticomyces elasticus]|nr:hypothetical protein LTS10_005202 [Elasticomyces elasticus]
MVYQKKYGGSKGIEFKKNNFTKDEKKASGDMDAFLVRRAPSQVPAAPTAQQPPAQTHEKDPVPPRVPLVERSINAQASTPRPTKRQKLVVVSSDDADIAPTAPHTIPSPRPSTSASMLPSLPTLSSPEGHSHQAVAKKAGSRRRSPSPTRGRLTERARPEAPPPFVYRYRSDGLKLS